MAALVSPRGAGGEGGGEAVGEEEERRDGGEKVGELTE